MKTPRELFHMACEELMPLSESVCVLILKVTITVSFVLFVFSLIMLHNVSATPVMRALLTFLSGSLPKNITIYMDWGYRGDEVMCWNCQSVETYVDELT